MFTWAVTATAMALAEYGYLHYRVWNNPRAILALKQHDEEEAVVNANKAANSTDTAATVAYPAAPTNTVADAGGDAPAPHRMAKAKKIKYPHVIPLSGVTSGGTAAGAPGR
jgi:hypothetical protein